MTFRNSCAITLVALGISVFASTVSAAEPDPFGIIIKPIPEKVIVLTFDDSCRSHATFVAPLLKKYGFGATFYITEFGGGPFADKTKYMTWEQIKGLHEMGFEVGNHTLGHGGLSGSSPENCLAVVKGIEARCLAHGIPKPTTFCWPMYHVSKWSYQALSEAGYIFSRGGHERTYHPSMDAPLDVPSFTIHDGTLKKAESFAHAAKQATPGRCVVYTFHGVPDVEHPTVGVEPAKFEALMKYLKDNQYTVISMRDMAKYIDVKKAAKFLPFPMTEPWGGVLKDGNKVYVTVSKIPDSGKVTLPSMTTKIDTAYFLEDEKRTALVVEKSDSGIQTIVIPESPLAGRPDYPTVIVADLEGGPVATIIDFQIPGAGEGGITGNEIQVKVPMTTDLSQLTPLYHTGSPEVVGTPASGVAVDFTKPVIYTVTAADGSTRKFTVTVTPSLGTTMVSNPSFERFDSSGEFDRTMSHKPTGAIWKFVREGTGGEIGIRGRYFQHGSSQSRHCLFMRGRGNGVSQPVVFEGGNYVFSFDAAKRIGYEKTPAAIVVTIDGEPVYTVEIAQISEKWASYSTPEIPIKAGTHVMAVILGEGGGMDLLDNVALQFVK